MHEILEATKAESTESMTEHSGAADMKIHPLAYLRSMAIILWTALRHPFLTTEIDLRTGRVIRHY